MYRLSPESEEFVLSCLPQNVVGGPLTLNAFYYIYAIAVFDGVKNGAELFDAYMEYKNKFMYEHLETYHYAKKVEKDSDIYIMSKRLCWNEGKDELCKMYFPVNQKQKEKIIEIFDRELF